METNKGKKEKSIKSWGWAGGSHVKTKESFRLRWGHGIR